MTAAAPSPTDVDPNPAGVDRPRVGVDRSPFRRRLSSLRTATVPVTLLIILAVLILAPVGFVALAAFTTKTPRPGNIGFDLTIENFRTVFSSGSLQATWNSLKVGISASVLALLIGGFLAFVTARTNVYGRRFLYLVGFVPMLLPSYVGALAWSVLGGKNAGLLNIALRDFGLPGFVNINNLSGLVLVLALYYAPYGFLLMHGALSLMNPELEQVANLHGARPGQVLRTVTFPLVTPAILGAAVLTFVQTVENFPVSQIIGGAAGVDTLPTYVYRLMNSTPTRGNEAAAVAIALVAVVLVVTAVQRRILARRKFTTISGKGMRPRQIDLGRWRLPALLAGLMYFLLSSVLPVLALLFVSLHSSPYIGTITGAFTRSDAFTAKTYVNVLSSAITQRATVNSVLVSVAAAALGTALAFVVAYVVHRTILPARRLLEYVSMLPLAIPAIVLGLGLLWTWLIAPVPVYGTLTVMVIAFTAAQMPQGFRGVASSIVQVDRDLEDSAVMHGASRPRAVAAITAPLLRVGLTSTFLLLLMLSMRELTVPLFLFTSDTRLLSIVIFDDFDNGILQRAAATSLLYCVVILALSVLARRFGAKELK
ncbi:MULTISPECIES: ABC transporter permease [unclassified Micromonospora]